MESVFLALAMPAFFLFLGLEYYITRLKNKQNDIYKYESSVSNITIGIAERLLSLFISAAFYSLFKYVYDHFAIFHIGHHWLIWIGLLLAADFVWYWYHRLGHEINFFWAAHIVHHQSEEFNYTVSARITTFQALIRNIFWCVLPLIGFHPNMVITVLVVHGAYSFFTHTQLIRNTRWMEYIFITPSLHGVHHASNEKYLDKNYGDVFVFWDKLFGTFQTEDEKPVYGLTHPLKSYSFLWQHFHYYLEIAEACRRTKGLRNKWNVVFGSPAVMNQDIRPFLERKFLQHRVQSSKKHNFKGYLNFQLILSVALLILVTIYYGQLSTVEKTVSLLFLIITQINCGALLDQRKWIYYLEYIRIFIVLFWLSYTFHHIEFFVYPAITLLSLDLILPLNKWYVQYVIKLTDEQKK